MKISVITVCYNAARCIDGCLRSVAEQTHRDIEHIIIDGLSKDKTVSIVRRYSHVARLISERDRGIYDAMNKGLDFVTGDYILFLNADDKFASADSVAKAVAAIEADPGGDVYYGSLEIRPLDGPTEVFRPPPPDEAPTFMVWGCLPHQSTLARPSVFDRAGRFDLRYRCHSDYDWYLRVLADPGIEVRSLNEVIGSFQLGGISSQLIKGQPEVWAIQNESPLYASPEWDKKRIEILQKALLQERLTAGYIRDELHAARNRVRSLREALGPRGLFAVTASVKLFAGMLRDWARLAPRRTRWWMLNACVRHLPPGIVDVLRGVRSRMRPERSSLRLKTGK